VIAISHHQASEALGISIAAIIHHGIDVERTPVRSGTGGYAAVLGRMHPNKGIEEAIRAARAAGMPPRIAAKMTELAEREYFNTRVAPHLGGDITWIEAKSSRASGAVRMVWRRTKRWTGLVGSDPTPWAHIGFVPRPSSSVNPATRS
jgi:hypothetical protein